MRNIDPSDWWLLDIKTILEKVRRLNQVSLKKKKEKFKRKVAWLKKIHKSWKTFVDTFFIDNKLEY